MAVPITTDEERAFLNLDSYQRLHESTIAKVKKGRVKLLIAPVTVPICDSSIFVL